jgi:signal peptidase II
LREFHRKGAPEGVPAGHPLCDLQTARGAPLIESRDEDPAPGVAVGAADDVRRDPRLVSWLGAVALAVIALDVSTKLWVVEGLGESRKVSLLGGRLLLQQTRNPGAAFGVATGSTIVFSVVAVAVIAVIVRTARRLRSASWALVLGLLLGGAIGNLADRVLRSPGPLRGRVVDWINFGPDRFPLFNAADSAIVIGGAIAALLALRGIEIDTEPEAKQQPVATEQPSRPNAEPGDR